VGILLPVRTQDEVEQREETAERPARRWRRWPWVVAGSLLVPPLLAVGFYLLPPSAAVALLRPALDALSDAPPLPANLEAPAERSVLLAADGSELAVLFDDANRMRLEVVPPLVEQAVLAAEDQHFRDHPGVSHRAILRAALANVFAGEVAQGGSTLTQQLVKNAYLPDALYSGGRAEQSLRRKATEASYALELERRLTKDEILRRYLDEAYFGQGVSGLATAAELYFGKTPDQLDADEAALLAGLLRAPAALNPAEHPDDARARRDTVLEQMAATGALSPAEAEQAQAQRLGLDLHPLPPRAHPFFVAYVEHALLNDRRLDDVLGADPRRREQLVYRGGLQIRTSLDPRLQGLAERALAATSADPRGPQLGLVTVEPGSGLVRALAVGPKVFGPCPGDAGDCVQATQVNPLVPGLGGSGRQPGSAFKPFVDGAALAAGIPPGWQEETAGGQPIAGCDDDGKPYAPENYSPDPGVKDMATALRVSNNVYHAKLAARVGPATIVAFAERAGLRDATLPPTCALALGAGSVYAVNLAAAYAGIAAGGEVCAPQPLLAVTRPDGRTTEIAPACEAAIAPDVATRLAGLLQGPVAAGTATAAQLGRPVLGKTGTTDDYRDAWFVGAVPQLATAAWVGFEQPAPLVGLFGEERVTGGSVPAQLWARYMRPAVAPLPVEAFPAAPPVPALEVPGLVGMTEEQLAAAREQFARDHTLHLVEQTVTDWRPAGTVVSQEPAAGARVDAGHFLTVGVSDGTGQPPPVPDVRGDAEADARRTLEAAGYAVAVEREQRTRRFGAAPDVPDGVVAATDPPPGTPLRPGATVTLTVVTYDLVFPSSSETEASETEASEAEPTERPSAPAPPSPRPERAERAETAPVRVTIARVVAEPRGEDLTRDGGEHVVLRNDGRDAVDVSGWTITTESGSRLVVGDRYVLAPGAQLAVFTGEGSDTPRRFFNGLSSEVLTGRRGEVTLRDRAGDEVDRSRY
jgi:membrane peptidoglycan carboxypeptidase